MDMRPAASPHSTPVLLKHSEEPKIDQWLVAGCNALGECGDSMSQCHVYICLPLVIFDGWNHLYPPPISIYIYTNDWGMVQI